MKHWKFPEIPFFAIAHASNVEPDVFWAERTRRQKNGPEQNSSSREAGKRTAKTEKTGRRILTNEDKHDRIKK